MTMSAASRPIPWNDSAVCVRRPDGGEPGEREIVVQGSLRDVVDAIGGTPALPASPLVIALPDRRTEPFRYAGDEIRELIRLRLQGE